ncbi:large ribosomal subunit protein mL54 [Halyomorpha halys]|uniref:large ribosomal subunit protein mL54 n=1 Tax=Halyomorpha halys TaxID=286706 RepID=UPI0006D51C60|nr:39S ribosomal protein L54, mitochondrial [Halyomorpha halys]
MILRLSRNFIYAYFTKRNQATVIPGVGKAKKKAGKYGAVAEKIQLPVETDAQKLVNFVCGSNILKEGKDIELKADDEYPDWLWKLNTGKPKPLEELDPDSKAYWLRVKKMAMVRNNKLSKLKRF